MRYLVLANGNLDFHPRIIDTTQNLDHTPHRLRHQRGALGQLDRDHLPRLGLANGLGGNQDVATKPPILWRHQPHTTFVEQTTDDRHLAPLQNLQDLPLRTPFAVHADDAHLHLIPMHHRAHLLRREIDTHLSTLGHNETVAIAVPLHLPHDFTHQIHRKLLGTCHVRNFDARIQFFAADDKINCQIS